MTDVRLGEEAKVTIQMVQWLAAHCPEHDKFEPLCLDCQATPQCCPDHPQVNGTFPGFSGEIACQACFATRPGYIDREVIAEGVMSAEEACHAFGIPHEYRRGGKFIRLPMNLLRRSR